MKTTDVSKVTASSRPGFHLKGTVGGQRARFVGRQNENDENGQLEGRSGTNNHGGVGPKLKKNRCIS